MMMSLKTVSWPQEGSERYQETEAGRQGGVVNAGTGPG